MSCDSFIKDNLLHEITIVPAGTTSDGISYDKYGDPVSGGAGYKNIPCLIDARQSRSYTSDNRLIIYDATITFDADTPLEIEFTLKDGYNQFGVELLKKAKVISIDYIQSIDDGILAKQARVQRY